MSDFFSEFNAVSKEEWQAKLIADLKGKDPSILQVNDEIEELNFSSFHHKEDRLNEQEVPGNYPYTRGMNRAKNTWNNLALVHVRDEADANKIALKKLMSGATGLVFAALQSDLNWEKVLEGIELSAIQTQFYLTSVNDYHKLREITKGNELNIQYNFDFIQYNKPEEIQEILRSHAAGQRFAMINGKGVFRIGATTWQEVAFCLSTGHSYLVELMKSGMSIDDASACIGIQIGVGSNYFYSIAKIRALRKLWAKMIQAYTPEHDCSHNCMITAIIGHSNKSLSDPYTNLLRQTTETLSALAAGVDNVLVLPYDLYSKNGRSELAARMALNIPLILQEESYLDLVIDPIGGSYAIEHLTEEIAQKAWSYFQELETIGCMFEDAGRAKLIEDLTRKRNQRVEHFREGKQTLIGINKFPNPDAKPSDWLDLPTYLGVPALNYELISTNVSA